MMLLSKQRIGKKIENISLVTPKQYVCVLQTHLFLIVIGVTFYILFMVIAIFFSLVSQFRLLICAKWEFFLLRTATS